MATKKSKVSKGVKVSEVSKVSKGEITKPKVSKGVEVSGVSKVPQVKVTKEKKIFKKEPRFAIKATTVKKTTRGEPQTMEELLLLEGERMKGLKRADIVDGVVIEIASKSIYIDVGAKTEGVVLGREFERSKDYIRNLKPGDKVKVYVGDPETMSGQILLSLRQAAGNYSWDKYIELLASGEMIEVKGREVNRGGVIVDAPFSLQGFIPGSQIGSVWQGKMDTLVGRSLPVKVIEVNREQNRLVFSERLISDAEKLAKAAKAIKGLKVGAEMTVKVHQIVPFGLFVRSQDKEEPVEGLVHISEVSWQKVDNLPTLFKIGDELKVAIISVEGGRVQFSLKQLQTDPWKKLEEKYPVDTKIKAKVIRLASFGALVEIEPGIEGLVHISKIPPELSIKEGDKLDAYIESVDLKSRRISLGIVLSQKPVGYK